MRKHMMIFGKKQKIFLGIVGGLAVVFGLLAYFQSQGILTVFPTAEDRRLKQILVIDRSKFAKPDGLPDEQFQAKITELSALQKRAQDNLDDADRWFDFGSAKEFLNDHEGAASAWERSFELQPLNFVTAGNLGNVYQYFIKNWQKADFYYHKALEVRPDYTLAYQGLADLYRFNWKEKQSQFEPQMLEAVQKDPQNRATYYGDLVEFFATRDLPTAKKYFEEVKKINPKAAAGLLDSYPQLQQ